MSISSSPLPKDFGPAECWRRTRLEAVASAEAQEVPNSAYNLSHSSSERESDHMWGDDQYYLQTSQELLKVQPRRERLVG